MVHEAVFDLESFPRGSIEPKRIKYANQVNEKALYDFRYEVNKFII